MISQGTGSKNTIDSELVFFSNLFNYCPDDTTDTPVSDATTKKGTADYIRIHLMDKNGILPTTQWDFTTHERYNDLTGVHTYGPSTNKPKIVIINRSTQASTGRKVCFYLIMFCIAM